ncbi:MAG: oxidoreductase [Verrucomicrobiales bacterium]|nr:oxidoreductase [Verrucomicrobiales bacterium]|tara:strand:+ start:396 stop:1811 length:1416 start_codon:yes stop_codon:yes gene_type:complete
MNKQLTPRRDFLKKSAAATFGFSVLPSYLATGKPADGKVPPSKRVNLGCVGVGGRASGVIPSVCAGGKAAPVAFCDVDFNARRVEKNLERFPGVKQYQDFRVMLEKSGKDIDAVTVVTPDHTHFPAAILAMSMGKHVYVEKPLTHSYAEADMLMKAEKRFGVVTQMGNQGHTSGGSAQFEALLKAGALKNIDKVDAWKTAGLWFMRADQRISKYPPKEKKPDTLDWDLWCGPAEMKPFSSKYHPFNWRAFYLYGNGMLGDWGAHIIDFVHDFLKLGQPTHLSPLLMDDANDVIFPLSSHLVMHFPDRGKNRPALELTWRDGANCHPTVPEQFHTRQKDGTLKAPKMGGAGTVIYRADRKFALTRASHSSKSSIIPTDAGEKYRDALNTPNPKYNHSTSFTAACMGEDKTRSPFSIAGDLTKTLMLGVICQYLNEELDFDRKSEQFVGNKRANALLEGPPPRKGWEEFYRMF